MLHHRRRNHLPRLTCTSKECVCRGEGRSSCCAKIRISAVDFLAPACGPSRLSLLQFDMISAVKSRTSRQIDARRSGAILKPAREWTFDGSSRLSGCRRVHDAARVAVNHSITAKNNIYNSGFRELTSDVYRGRKAYHQSTDLMISGQRREGLTRHLSITTSQSKCESSAFVMADEKYPDASSDGEL